MQRFSKYTGLMSLGLAVSLSVALLPQTSYSQEFPAGSSPEELMTAYGAALTANPELVEAFINRLAEDVDWSMAGDPNRFEYPGEYQGREAVQTFFANLTRTFVWTQFTPLDVLTEERLTPSGERETRVAVRVAQAGKGAFTGEEFAEDFVYLFTIGSDGLIQSFDGFYNTYAAAAAATGVPAPAIPADDELTGQAVTLNPDIDAEMARRVAVETWQALINGDLQRVSQLSAPSTQWSFAIGGPEFLPFVNAAQGMTSDGQPLNADFSNAGDIITQILQPRMNIVTQGNLVIQDTYANGNRVLVHLRETDTAALETGNRYDLDIFSWMTVDAAGQVTSNEVVVDTYATVAALRPGMMFPLPNSPLQARRHLPGYVTGSRVNGIVVTFDAQGNYTGILGQANFTDSPLVRPSAITYGTDGNLYVTSSDVTDRTLGNEVLVYDGVSGEFRGVFGEATNAASGLLNPTGIKFGPDGNLYVASAYTSQVLRYSDETGEFMGVYATRVNGFPDNVVPVELPVPDFTVLVFGPDGDLYVTSLLDNSVLRYAGPSSANPGEFLGIYGQANDEDSELNQPRAIVFGPDADLYVASAATGRVLRYAGPLKANPGEFLGVFADVGSEISTTMGIEDMDFNADGSPDMVIQNGLGFGSDGNLYVSSSIELYAEPVPMPTGGSQVRVYSGPLHSDAGAFLGVFGEADTVNGRLLLPTTPEFVYNENTFPSAHRYDAIAFVAGVNSDRPLSEDGVIGFFQSDNTDAIAAYNQNLEFLGFLSEDLIGGDNPIDGIGGITLAPNGHILVSSWLSDQVLQFNSLTGKYMGVFGDASPAGTGDDPNTAENEGLDFPAGITVGPDNNVYVVDLMNKRILGFDGYTGDFLDDPTTPANEGVVVQLSNEDAVRLTDLVFGADGRIYIGLNPPLEEPSLESAEVRVYRPDGTLETTLTGPPEQPFDFVAALDTDSEGRLYITDDPASVVDTTTGVLLAPDRESRLFIYDIPNVHPLLVNSATGMGDPNGVRQQPILVSMFNLGMGNGGAVTVGADGTIYVSEPWSGQIAYYNDAGDLLGTLPALRLPDAALPENGGIDADGRPRPTGSVFVQPLQ